jgi:single-stranded-DNA-specific exonuclease
MIQKRWTTKEANPEWTKSLYESLKIHPILCRILASRGIRNFQEAKDFFRTDETHLLNPFLMKGMQKSIDRIHQAITNNEKILIYGDYDVDGTTSVAVVYQFFKTVIESKSENSSLKTQIEFYIPHRFTEGYGVSQKGIDYAIEHNFTLIITLDCGIKSVDLVEYANQHNIDTIVSDHHLPGEIVPNAFAILNPKQADCPYPYKELCGCGIGYKIISAYASQYNIDQAIVNYHLDLVATAIAADIVPITGENRTLCVLGLQKANQNPSVPLQALKTISKLEKEFTITDLVFIIAPRVNAAGRMDDAKKAVELFIETDVEKAKDLASILQEDNNDRKDVDRMTTIEALYMIAENEEYQNGKSTVVYDENWHKGIVGIVASRIIEHHYKPTIVLTLSNGKITGSARSIKGFNMFEGLNQCADYLENYGGHYFAAGLTMKEENLVPFKIRFDEVVKATVPDELFFPEIEVDAEINFNDINENFLKILNQFAPHGPENMKPIFMTKSVMDYQGFSTIVKEKHLRFVVYQNGSKTINGIGFNMAEKLSVIKEKQQFEILYHIEENTWNGNTSIQLKVIDIR